jgi:DNA polymerase III gamma/tau subunit
MLVYKTTASAEKYLDLTENEAERLKQTAKLFSKETIVYHCRILDDTLYSISKSGSVKRIVAEMALIKMCDRSLDNSSDAMLSRIEALESRLAILASGGAVIDVTASTSHTKSEPKKEKAPDTEVKAKVKEEEQTPISAKNEPDRELTVWADAVDRILKSNPTMSGMFDGSSAFTDGSSYTIYVKSVFAKTMLSRANGPAVIAAGISLASGQSVSADTIKIEIKDIKPKGGDAMDDLFS